MTLFLVRHGRTLGTPPADELDPAGFDDVWALRDRLPQGAAWFSAPEPAAVATCQLLTESEAGILPGLRAPGTDEAAAVVGDRVVGTVRELLAQEAGRDVVLVGYAEAWVALAGEAARRLGTPGVLTLDEPLGSAR